ALQQDLPTMPRPFDQLAREANVSIEDLLSAAGSYLANGCMRRFAAVLKNRSAGFSANAMGAWIVPHEQQDRFGRVAARFSTVSQCYLRQTYDDWPYSIFTMVHGTRREECENVLAAIADETGVNDYTALYSTHEYKKVRVKYFTPEIAEWERNVAKVGADYA